MTPSSTDIEAALEEADRVIGYADYSAQADNEIADACQTEIKHWRTMRQALDLAGRMRWRTDMENAPKEEDLTPFLVKWENDMNEMVVLQVSWFEGWLYPDYKGGIVDWDDRITDVKEWMPLPPTDKESE